MVSIQDLLNILDEAVNSFTARRFGETRTADLPLEKRDFGPIIQELIDRNAIPADFQDRTRSEQRDILSRVPDDQLAQAKFTAKPMVTFQDFMSVYLSKCGNDERQFQTATELWNREKETIRTLTKSELRQELNCG